MAFFVFPIFHLHLLYPRDWVFLSDLEYPRHQLVWHQVKACLETGFHSEVWYSGCRHTGHVRLKAKEQTVSQYRLSYFIFIFSFLGCLSITQQCPVYTVVSSPDRVHSVVFSKKTVCQAMQGNKWWTSIPSKRDLQYPLSPHPKENEMTFDGGRFTISVTQLFSNSLAYSLLNIFVTELHLLSKKLENSHSMIEEKLCER